jgi:predicted transcriptional regulator
MAPRTKKKEYRTSVILSENQHLRLKELADKEDASIAWVIRKAIEAYLGATPKQDKQ